LSATTVFRDKLGAGISFPIARDALDKHLVGEVVALYFVSTSSWLRQAVPLDSPRLPVLRLQRHRLQLRVGNERIAQLPESCSLHLIVYALPSRLRAAALEAIVAGVHDWTDVGRLLTGEANGLVAYFRPPDRLSVEAKLPTWL
jgi:hypothetical protein